MERDTIRRIGRGAYGEVWLARSVITRNAWMLATAAPASAATTIATHSASGPGGSSAPDPDPTVVENLQDLTGRRTPRGGRGR